MMTEVGCSRHGNLLCTPCAEQALHDKRVSELERRLAEENRIALEREVKVAALTKRLAAAQSEVIVCDRCKGKGYHHGFGEDGYDPDWCEKCGGSGSWLKEQTQQVPR
jgi:DnaJ-class molecular chaperone